jgi:hypothetical protein
VDFHEGAAQLGGCPSGDVRDRTGIHQLGSQPAQEATTSSQPQKKIPVRRPKPYRGTRIPERGENPVPGVPDLR